MKRTWNSQSVNRRIGHGDDSNAVASDIQRDLDLGHSSSLQESIVADRVSSSGYGELFDEEDSNTELQSGSTMMTMMMVLNLYSRLQQLVAIFIIHISHTAGLPNIFNIYYY